MKFTFILSLVRKPNQWLELMVTSKGKTYDQKAAFGPPTSSWGPRVPVKRVRYISVAATATSTAPVMPKDSLWTTRGRSRHATISGLSGLWTSDHSKSSPGHGSQRPLLTFKLLAVKSLIELSFFLTYESCTEAEPLPRLSVYTPVCLVKNKPSNSSLSRWHTEGAQ